jgi:N,N'-diacetyllegionaminate synthase
MLEDHESALNPDEFLEFSDVIRKCFSSLETSVISQDFGMSKSEEAYRKMIRRHVVASKNLVSGSIISSEDLVLKRTSSEDFITDINDVYEKTLIADVEENKALSYLNFK